MGVSPDSGTHSMTDGESLLAAIIDDPAADDRRLVYADWLEENGQDERAEFIRAQIERERLSQMSGDEPGYDPRRVWDAIEAEGKYDYERGVWCPFGSGATWRRGFIASVRCTWDAWQQHGRAVALAHPLERVELTDREPREDNGYWRWFFDHGRGRRDELPLPIHRKAHSPGASRPFRTLEAATAAVSAALLATARADCRTCFGVHLVENGPSPFGRADLVRCPTCARKTVAV